MFEKMSLYSFGTASATSIGSWVATRKRPITRVFYLSIYGLIALLGFAASPSRGGNLNLTAQAPDLAAGFISTNYDATTGILSADGWPISFNVDDGSTQDSIVGGQYQLSAQITPTGQPVSGSLNITGTVSIPGLVPSGTLLTGTLSQFGFPDAGGDVFEFVYDVTGGDLAPYYHGETGVILDARNSGFMGSFANNFSASAFVDAADNTMVPESSTILLLLGAMAFGLPVLGFRRLRRMSNSE